MGREGPITSFTCALGQVGSFEVVDGSGVVGKKRLKMPHGSRASMSSGICSPPDSSNCRTAACRERPELLAWAAALVGGVTLSTRPRRLVPAVRSALSDVARSPQVAPFDAREVVLQ